ncbi:MAG: DNA repair protein RadA [marine bacterium B5-7]|nr:MAG: DNA repair protein RadA [marine bacterium B5-7]
MASTKAVFFCRDCGGEHAKWTGQCQHCGAWNTLEEAPVTTPRKGRTGAAGKSRRGVTTIRLNEIATEDSPRLKSGSGELDRVLGGGVVPGSAVLIGGDPGIGKSTLLLQILHHLSTTENALYVTGEESLQQVALRGERLGCRDSSLSLLAENNVETVLETARTHKPRVLVVDSIQTIYSESVGSAPGSVTQVRECAQQLVMFAKRNDCTVILVGHVTKDGALAGPRVLEHMVDSVLYFEGDKSSRFRMIRAIKNRFGAANEIGVFAMTDGGLKDVANPSAIFLNRQSEPASGTVAFATWEGTRPLLVEVQALVDSSSLAHPRRLGLGLDQNRLSMLLAVLHRHGGYALGERDVFVNLVGGVRVTEPGVDLAVLLAVISSFCDKPLSRDLIVFGEVGLSGEIRPVQGGAERLREAAKLGFTQAVVPHANRSGARDISIKTLAAKRLPEVLDHLSF